MPAPKGNLNASRNGGRLTRLTLGELPVTMRRQTTQARVYRRGLESLVIDAKGEVDATDAHLIDEAATAEVHGAVCRWLLRERLDKMTVQDILTCSREILKAKTVRNRAVDRLGLGPDARENAIDALYSDPPEQPGKPPGNAVAKSKGAGKGKTPVRPRTPRRRPYSRYRRVRAMTRFDAHAMFCIRPDGGHFHLPPECDEDIAPAFCAAFAVLSGMLDDCKTQEDLDEAVRHGQTLASIGTFTMDDFHEEVQEIITEVVEWGRQAERHVAELN